MSIAEAYWEQLRYTSDVKCVKCDQKKGKRSCPALGKLICTHCCGEKRVSEIPCPPDCSFLASGQAYHWRKKYASILDRELDHRKRAMLYETTQQFHQLLGAIEWVIVAYASGLKSLRDRDILQALALLKETYTTEAKGVIYEASSSNPLAQSLSREVHEFLEKQREQAAEQGFVLRPEHILQCLEVLLADLDHHLAQDKDGNSFIRFIQRNHPDAAKSKAGGIILA